MNLHFDKWQHIASIGSHCPVQTTVRYRVKGVTLHPNSEEYPDEATWSLKGVFPIRQTEDFCVLKDTARCLFSRSKRFEQPRKALAPAGGWACPPKSGSLVNLRCLCHKEDELKQLKSELAALDRKIQLELAPPTPEIAEKEKDGQEVKPDAGDVRNVPPQHTEDVPQIRSPVNERSPSGNFIADHVIIGRQGFQIKDDNRPKGIKI